MSTNPNRPLPLFEESLTIRRTSDKRRFDGNNNSKAV
jgi:hypothetical protein